MICREVAELLKSDYLDQETSPVVSREIKAHLDSCEQCRQLETELAANRVIFKQALRSEPPERVWNKIRSAIASENEELDEPVSPGFIERLKFLIWPAKPVFAWSGALAVLVVAAVVSSVFLRNLRLAEKNNDAESLAVYSFSAESSEQIAGLGTNIEEYFL